MYVYIHVYIHTHTCIYTCIYIYIHSYIHILVIYISGRVYIKLVYEASSIRGLKLPSSAGPLRREGI